MMSLATILSIVFGSVMIVIGIFLCKASLIAAYLSFGVVDYSIIFVQLSLKILLIYERHKLLSLN